MNTCKSSPQTTHSSYNMQGTPPMEKKVLHLLSVELGESYGNLKQVRIRKAMLCGSEGQVTKVIHPSGGLLGYFQVVRLAFKHPMNEKSQTKPRQGSTWQFLRLHRKGKTCPTPLQLCQLSALSALVTIWQNGVRDPKPQFPANPFPNS